jgi:hypothetical protein
LEIARSILTLLLFRLQVLVTLSEKPKHICIFVQYMNPEEEADLSTDPENPRHNTEFPSLSILETTSPILEEQAESDIDSPQGFVPHSTAEISAVSAQSPSSE